MEWRESSQSFLTFATKENVVQCWRFMLYQTLWWSEPHGHHFRPLVESVLEWWRVLRKPEGVINAPHISYIVIFCERLPYVFRGPTQPIVIIAAIIKSSLCCFSDAVNLDENGLFRSQCDQIWSDFSKERVISSGHSRAIFSINRFYSLNTPFQICTRILQEKLFYFRSCLWTVEWPSRIFKRRVKNPAHPASLGVENVIDTP